MALEQAQQQFAAAARIGYESRPLNLFYGISQAGRAIAAGSHLLGRGTDHQWQASGHGLTFDAGVSAGVLPTPVEQDGLKRDSFSRVSIAIGSPLDFGSVEFGAAMNQLLDYTIAFQEPEAYHRPIPHAPIYNVQSKRFPMDLEVDVPGLADGHHTTAEQVRALLAPYPALRDLAVAVDDDGCVRWSQNEGRCFLVVPSADVLKNRDEHGFAELKGTTYYRRNLVLLPSAGNSEQALRPLMSWWIVLFALSMLARYSPSKWTGTLSLTESPIASRIELLLDAALDAVPELLWEELLRLSHDETD